MNRPNLVLVGPMGSGKSSVGRELANWLGYRLIDVDAQIEFEQDRSISEIFKSDGESAFRALERRAVAAAAAVIPCVIATGGGAFQDPENRSALQATGRIYYLRATPEELFERVRHSRTRPLLQVPDPLASIRDLLALRTPTYELADAIIDTGMLTRDQVVAKILRHHRGGSGDNPSLRL